MKIKVFSIAVFVLTSFCSFGQHEYAVVKTFHISSPGGWDYIAVNNNKVYVSHGTQVNILNEESGDSIGVIPNTNGVHGIAFDNTLHRGYTSNGRSNNVTVFDLNDNKILGEIATAENPDAIMYEPYTKTIITCNGRGKSLSIINPRDNTVISTIDVGGKPETAVSDESGKVFVNIEDKSEIAEVDLKTYKVTNRWSLNPGEGPSGLVYDKATKRLFSTCDKLLVVMNAMNGNIVAKIPIGNGTDGAAFDSADKIIFTSNGEGTITAVKEISADNYKLLGNYKTKRGARTMTIDEKKHKLFLPTADFEAAQSTTGRPKMIPGTFQVLVVQ
jgi:DNA-binding beta-propeller fold protein YncE